MPELLRKSDLPAVMNMSVSLALETLKRYGIKPVDFGPGRGRGLRWHKRAVMTVIDTLHTEAQTAKGKRVMKPKEVRPVLGKSAHELYAELYERGAVQ